MNRKHACRLVLFSAATLFGAAYPAAAQCTPGWNTLPIQGLAGIDGVVTASTTWDPDGNGPAPAVMVVGGSFSVAGEALVNNIASWNGTSWQSLGSGVSDGDIAALAVFDGKLIAAGTFETAGGNPASHIAQWDGTTWSPLGAGTDDGVGAGFVNTLAVFNGALYAGGQFTIAGVNSASRIAKWDGTDWSTLTDDGGLTNGVSLGNVVALGVYDSKLIVGGSFTIAGNLAVSRLASWDGTTWADIGGGTDNTVASLAVYGGELIVGGRFLNAGGNPASRIARWNGTAWNTLSTGMTATIGAVNVADMVVFGSDLIATGGFTSAGGVTARRIARWDGSIWQPLSTQGLDFLGDTLEVYNGQLYCGGTFSSAGGVAVSNIARWNGTEWDIAASSGFNGVVSAIHSFSGRAVIGGNFNRAGSLPANAIAQRDLAGWSPLSSGLNNGVLGFTTLGSNLVAAGAFTTAGGSPAKAVAQWDGSIWSGFGTGPNMSIVSEVLVHAGTLYAGGPTPLGIESWDGSTWSVVGGGVTGGVSALASYGGNLVVAGSFDGLDSGAVSANSIATWDGTAWAALGLGLTTDPVDTTPGSVNAMALFTGDLIVAGNLGAAGGNAVFNVARWNGTLWQAMGDGLGDPTFGESVDALAVYDGQLYAGGSFTSTGANFDVYSIARWNASTSSWMALPDTGTSDLNGTVNALYPLGNDLHVGGSFSSAGGQLAVNWVRWRSNICAADVDDGSGTGQRDCGVGIEDLLYYLLLFEVGTEAADVDDGSGSGISDGGVGIEDLLYFLQRFELGC